MGVTLNATDYYSQITVGRDLEKFPTGSDEDTKVGYQYDGLTEEDRLVRKILKEHYNKVYQENLSHSDPMAYIASKYCDVTSTNFCSYMISLTKGMDLQFSVEPYTYKVTVSGGAEKDTLSLLEKLLNDGKNGKIYGHTHGSVCTMQIMRLSTLRQI